MKKHAYLIIAHNQLELLKVLIHCLDSEYNDLYIHLDKKWTDVNFKSLYSCAKKSYLFILKNRIDVKWGTYSQIQCELSLIKAASPNHYQYYHLMSGADLPLKSPLEIYNYFDAHDGTEFIHFDAPQCARDAYMRVAKYHFLIYRSGGLFLKLLRRTLLALQIGIDRGKKYNLTFQKGANWFSITDDLAQYLLSQQPLIEKVFKHTFCADELFLQTIVASSPFIHKVAPCNFCNNYATIQYCIDWKRGNPYIFRIEDYNMLMSSGMCFARKFDLNVDAQIIDKIKNHVTSVAESKT